jgi:hypothetical protein
VPVINIEKKVYVPSRRKYEETRPDLEADVENARKRLETFETDVVAGRYAGRDDLLVIHIWSEKGRVWSVVQTLPTIDFTGSGEAVIVNLNKRKEESIRLDEVHKREMKQYGLHKWLNELLVADVCEECEAVDGVL